MDAMVTDFVSL